MLIITQIHFMKKYNYKTIPELLNSKEWQVKSASIESNFKNALRKHSKNITLIIISHKLKNLTYADLILVFDKGKIVQTGNFTDLKNSIGIFRNLLKIQDKKEKKNVFK